MRPGLHVILIQVVIIMMVVSDSQKRAARKYIQTHIKRIPLDVQKEHYDAIKAAADANGETVNGFIKTAINERLERLAGSGDAAS